MKKNYIQPSVEQAQLMAGSVILTSPTGPSILPNNGNGTGDLGDNTIITD